MRIMLAGGGSGGPVSPVLAVALQIRKLKPRAQFLFVGTRRGPEKSMVADAGIKFTTVPAARWRRFFTIKNLFAPLVFIAGLVKAWLVVRRFRPDVVFSAGGFVAVPVCWAAAILGIPVVIHQQDVRIGLANKLIAPLARKITTAFEYTSKQFYSGSGLWHYNQKPKAEWVGNPVRPEITKSSDLARKFFKLHDQLPILLVLGGATGAKQINDLMQEILPQLVASHQVIHQTGKGKNTVKFTHPNYHPAEIISFEVYASALQAAETVICRAGLSTITELSALSKPSVVIPMPRTHQEDNAKILAATSAAIVLYRDGITGSNLMQAIRDLKFKPELAKLISWNMGALMPKSAATKLAKIVLSYAE